MEEPVGSGRCIRQIARTLHTHFVTQLPLRCDCITVGTRTLLHYVAYTLIVKFPHVCTFGLRTHTLHTLDTFTMKKKKTIARVTHGSGRTDLPLPPRCAHTTDLSCGGVHYMEGVELLVSGDYHITLHTQWR